MSRSTRPVLLLVSISALLLGTSCTTTVPGTAAPSDVAPGAPSSSSAAPQTDDAVTWVDGVCGSLLPFIRTAAQPPDISYSSEPAVVVEQFSEYLGRASDSVDGAITGLEAVGPSPVDGGDEVVRRLTETLTTFQTSFSSSKEKIDALDASDPTSLATGLASAVAPLEQLATLPDPTADLENSPELDRAARSAPNCQEIEREGR